jgi:hypothetical protein
MVATDTPQLPPCTNTSQAEHFCHHVVGQRRAAGRFVTTGLARLDALGEAHSLLLSDGIQKADDSLAEHTDAIELLLGKGLELYAGRIRLLLVIERFGHALTPKAVEASEQHHVEAPLVGIKKELLKLRPLGAAPAFLVSVFSIDAVA